MTARFDDWEGPFLEHYGVIGMRWGVHKNPERAFQKSKRRLQKLNTRLVGKRAKKLSDDAKLQKMNYGKAKLEWQRDQPGRGQDSKAKIQGLIDKDEKKISKQNLKTMKSNANYAKIEAKTIKWEAQMLKVFGTTSYEEFKNANKDVIDQGEKEVKKVLRG